MKIAIFSDCYLDLTGGIVTNINAEKRELEQRGHTVSVFSSAYPRSKKAKAKLAKNHIYPVKSCHVFGRGLTPIARRPRVVEKELQKTHPELKDYDIFYVHYEAGCSIAGLRLAKKYGIPAIQVMHGREDVGEQSLIPYGLRTFVAVMLNWFHSWYLPHPVKVKRDNYLATTIASARMWSLMINHANAADLVITPSRHFRDKLIHYGVTREVIALHHGVSDGLVSEPIAPRTFSPNSTLKIIWHSRITEEKRIMVLLKALQSVTGKYRLDIYGSGVEEPLAKTYAATHHINAVFHGEASYDTLWHALKNSHLDVLVSYNYDTFGMTLIEAEAAGTPVLFTDPDMKEIVPSSSYLLTADPSSAQIATAINSLFTDPSQITKMSEAMLTHRNAIKNSEKINKLEKIFSTEIKKAHKLVEKP